MKKWILMAALLALAACSSSDDNEIASGTVTDDDGNKAEYSVKGDGDKGEFSIKTEDGSVNITSNKDGDAKLPFGLTLYPGSTVQANVQMNQAAQGTKGSMVSFETTSSPDKVIAHYKSQVESAGFKIGTEISSGETKMFNATRNGKETVNVTATSEGDGKTTGNVIAGSQG